jgi:hypothetical protein
VNPFRPNSPVNPGMFVGRIDELNRLESHLVQARAGNPSNFMITGERGIGKSSLLNYFKWVAEGQIEFGAGALGGRERMKFLVLDTDVDSTTSQFALIRKFELALTQALAKSEPARAFLKDAWSFIERIEAKGVRIGRSGDQQQVDDLLFDEFAYSLSRTVQRICDDGASTLFNAKYDGVLILIDEADNGAKHLQLGAFCKLLTERLERRQCNSVLIGLAGLESLRNALAQSHPSAPRTFDEVRLGRLKQDEVSTVIDFCLARALKDNGRDTTITDDARAKIVALSDGYPHFVQQFGFSAFAVDEDDVIDERDFREGAFGKQGAMEKIGDRYYRDDFYNKIQQESYRQVLRVMADHLDAWVTKADIRAKFKGKTTILDNALHALRERGIILPKEGARGVYRLQHKGFALWIKLYTTDSDLFSESVSQRGSSEA